MVKLSILELVVVMAYCINVTARNCPAQSDQNPHLAKNEYADSIAQPVAVAKADESDEAVSSAVEEVLNQWEKTSSQIEKLEGKFSLQEFNHIFEYERAYEGRFELEAADLGWVTTLGIFPQRGFKSTRISKSGDVYSMERGSYSTRIVFEKELITRFDLERNDVDTFYFPPNDHQFQGYRLLGGYREQLLSFNEFLLGMNVDEATRRFKWSILKSDDDAVTLLAVRRTNPSRPDLAPTGENQELSPMADGPTPHSFWGAFLESIVSDQFLQDTAVRLDKKTFLPTHIRLRNCNQVELIYRLESLVVTKKSKSDSASLQN